MASRDSKVDNFANSRFFFFFVFFCWLLLGLVFWPRFGDPCICQSLIGIYVCHFLGQLLWIYHLFVWSTSNFLHISQWNTLPTQLCLVLYPFCANLLHSLFMWLMVSSLSLPTFAISLRLIYFRPGLMTYQLLIVMWYQILSLSLSLSLYIYIYILFLSNSL